MDLTYSRSYLYSNRTRTVYCDCDSEILVLITVIDSRAIICQLLEGERQVYLLLSLNTLWYLTFREKMDRYVTDSA
jgi:hypothetical protein